MQRVLNHIGIDIGSAHYSAALYRESDGSSPAEEYSNNLEGFAALEQWFCDHTITPSNSIICLEDTGVYGEELCYYFHAKGFSLVVESPKKTKQAFQSEDKDDDIDAQQLGEYAYRYFNKLRYWQPHSALVEQVNTLLAVREQFVKQLTAVKNERKALQRKAIQTPFALEILQTTINELIQKIKDLEKEIKRLFQRDPENHQKLKQMISMTGIGFLLSANLFAFAGGFEQPWDHRKLGARLGMVPRKHQSGSSVYRKPRSRRGGHSRIRKLLYLAAMSAIQHDSKSKNYFLRLQEKGKQGRLILNNIENKMLRTLCALVNNNSSFVKGYQSIDPALLKQAYS